MVHLNVSAVNFYFIRTASDHATSNFSLLQDTLISWLQIVPILIFSDEYNNRTLIYGGLFLVTDSI